MGLSVVILAAGQSTRMRSRQAKVLHKLAGRPMILYSLDAAQELGVPRPVIIVGHCAGQVQEVVGQDADYVLQAERLGTGHAVLQARPLFDSRQGPVLIYYGDMPLLRSDTLRALVEEHEREAYRSPLTILTVISDDPMGFGRIVRGQAGSITGIVEEKDATEEKLRIRELNCGVYCVDGAWLWPHLDQISVSQHGEYYLTDLVALAHKAGYQVRSVTINDIEEVQGINDRVQLANAERIMRRRLNEYWMKAGVTIIDPESVYIEPGVAIGEDTILHPNTYIQGATRIGEECEIGPNSLLRDAVVGHRCVVVASFVESAILEDNVDCGPFAHLRKGAHLAQGVHMGNFGEVKNSYLGPGTKMGHFSYLGDAEVGSNVNIGAGTVTCNYDGQTKHRTVIEDEVFIGSDTLLVAPVRIGAGARIGAGSVVTRDVPAGCTAFGVPARVRQDGKRHESQIHHPSEEKDDIAKRVADPSGTERE